MSLVVVPPREVEGVERKVGGPLVAVQKQMVVELLLHQEVEAMVQLALEVTVQNEAMARCSLEVKAVEVMAVEVMAVEVIVQCSLEVMAEQVLVVASQCALVEMVQEAQEALVVMADQGVVLEKVDH